MLLAFHWSVASVYLFGESFCSVRAFSEYVIEEIFIFVHPFVWTVLPLWSPQNFWCEGLDVFIVSHFLVVVCIPLVRQFFVMGRSRFYSRWSLVIFEWL